MPLDSVTALFLDMNGEGPTLLHNFSMHSGAVLLAHPEWQANQAITLSEGDKVLRIWDLRDGRCLKQSNLLNFFGSINTVAIGAPETSL